MKYGPDIGRIQDKSFLTIGVRFLFLLMLQKIEFSGSVPMFLCGSGIKEFSIFCITVRRTRVLFSDLQAFQSHFKIFVSNLNTSDQCYRAGLEASHHFSCWSRNCTIIYIYLS
jgi:hypothetical protein